MTRTIKPKRRDAGLPALDLRLDWRAYFRSFLEAHGEPHEVGGRLWFEDGWSYSATDHAGPEWPPPADPEQLRRALLGYWLKRREEVEAERRRTAAVLRGVGDMRSVKSLPLLCRVRRRDDAGRVTHEAAPVDAEALAVRLEGLTGEAIKCERKVRELRETGER